MAAHAKDSPSLSVQVDSRPSSSPFPSPSSSFLPPPVPGSHEFAVKPPPPPRKSLRDPLDASSAATPSTAGMSQQHPQRSNGKPSATQPTYTQTQSVVTNTNGTTASSNSALTPTTPTGATSPATTSTTAVEPTITTTTLPLPVPTPTTPTHIMTMLTAASPPNLSHAHRDSLTSNRPAPPSPATSRRASAAASTRSSRPPSTATHRFSNAPSAGPSIDLDAAAAPDDASLDPLTPMPPVTAVLSTLTTPTASPTTASARAVPTPEPAAAAAVRRSLLVKIRDFAFPTADARHRGQGADAPRATRRLNRPASTWSASSRSSRSSVEDDGADAPGSSTSAGGSSGGAWGGFRWGGLSLGWAGRAADGPASAGAGASDAGGGGGPSPVDFARNFDVASPEREIADPYASFAFPSASGSGLGSGPASGATSDDEADYFDADDASNADDEDDGEYADGEDGDGEDGGAERPLLPGTYRALYAFEPEGTAEMALAEDQLVRVVGRGGGVGWAVVERARGVGGGHALVPEGYLEVVRLDGEAEAEAEGSE